MAVSSSDLSALGAARESPGPALVHGVADLVVDRHHHGGVTGDAFARSRRRSGRACSSSPANSVLSPDSSTRTSRGTWATTKNGFGASAGSAPPVAEARTIEARTKSLKPSQSRWSHGVCPSLKMGPLGPGLQTGLGLGIGLGGQLGRHGAKGVVEAEERRSCCTSGGPGAPAATASGRAVWATSASSRTECSLACFTQLLIGLGAWPHRPAARTLSKDTSPDAERSRPDGAGHRLSRRRGSAPGRSGPRPRSARPSRPGSRWPPRHGRPRVGDTSPRRADPALGGGDLAEVLVETGHQLLVGLGRHRTEQSAAPEARSNVGRRQGHRRENGRRSRATSARPIIDKPPQPVVSSAAAIAAPVGREFR